MEYSLSQIPAAIEQRISLPRPNWDAIACWIEANVKPDSLEEAWTSVARDWLSQLAQALPNEHAVHESAEFLLLAPASLDAERVLYLCERARGTILDTLDGVASDDGFCKHAVLLFGDVDSYYDYVADFYPDEGEFALSGGMFVDVGYHHFAICPAYGDDYERTIAHELNHALLRHLPLPMWLNEGVTQCMEDVILGTSHFWVDRELVRRHRDYWNEETIQTFWSGESFLAPDDGQELSYNLSQVLFRNLLSDHPAKVNEILNSATESDAGNAAIVAACNVTLADRVAQFLGEGHWEPRP